MSHAVMGLIAVIFIQRAVHKVLISVFLSREFKHDETNRAWWTGKWYGRGLGTYAMSQPAREFIVKIIELSLWSSDFLTCHILLFLLTPPVLVPYIDRLHSTLLCESIPVHSPCVCADFGSSLVEAVEADPCPSLLDQAEATASQHRDQVWLRLRSFSHHLCCIDCTTYVFNNPRLLPSY